MKLKKNNTRASIIFINTTQNLSQTALRSFFKYYLFYTLVGQVVDSRQRSCTRNILSLDSTLHSFGASRRSVLVLETFRAVLYWAAVARQQTWVGGTLV